MDMAAALDGIVVLDMSRILAGPWCGQVLADLGATVIKVERPGGGDDTRTWGPPFLKDEEGNDTAEAAYYLGANRGKQSITLNISTPEGEAIINELASRADILIENYKMGGLKKYGLDYDSLKTDNPGLIYCSITGFGQTGPYAPRAGYDFVIQGLCGFMSITGERDDLPGGGPQKAGVAITDLTTGLYSTIAILAALQHRNNTGEGQYIDMALADSAVALMANMNMNYLTSGVPPKRYGNAHPNLLPYQVFDTADDPIIIAIGNDGQFRRWCELAGTPELADDERFVTNPQRIRHRDELIPLVIDLMKTQPRAWWVENLEKLGVPYGVVNNFQQVFEDPQVQARGMKFEMDHPTAGTVPMVRSPVNLEVSPPVYTRPPPTLGQHTDDVLRDILGKSDDEIAALKEAGVV
ncbi:MAG: CoA transferase [Rhodospirillaceae bacterium]|nr:CoA transferase [Rhodospirillaceae bacterium]|tara:strand:+ start:18900 stop:20129 length:1230 start_codon:yes stop_codon:yes gene_type:complete